MASVNYSFSLDSDLDKVIIAYLDSLPRGEKSGAIRDALHAHVEGAGVTLIDIYRMAQRIERKIDRGLVVAPGTGQPGQPSEDAHPGDDPGDVDPDTGDNLDGWTT